MRIHSILHSVFFLCCLVSFGWSQTDPAQILSRVDEYLLQQKNGVALDEFAPLVTVLRVFKMEAECEIWASSSENQPLKHVLTLPICAVDRKPGPKLREGDGKTPEGFFEVNFKHGFFSSQWFMWIDLDQVTKTGSPGSGSCFKTFIEYPTDLDRLHSKLAGFSNPGGAIFAHGNCVTAGCISFENVNYLPVFSYARHAFLNNGRVQIHIFPFRFDQVPSKTQIQLAQTYAKEWSPEMLLAFWMNLKGGFDRFNKSPSFLKVQTLFSPLRNGDADPRVLDLKKTLSQRKLFSGSIDNHFDTDLSDVVKVFQENHGLQVDGIVGVSTARAMNWFPPGYDWSGSD